MNKNKRSRSRLAAGALAAGVLVAGTLQAGAAPIAVPNQSFESTTAGDIDGWAGGFSIGASPDLPIVAPATGTLYVALAANYGIVSTSIDTGYDILSAGDVFTLTVAIGRQVAGGGSSMNLTSADYVSLLNLQLNGVTVASNTIITTGLLTGVSWAEATVQYTANVGDEGKSVGILLGGPTYTNTDPTNKRRFFDNVRLDVDPVPEPTTGGLILGSLAAFFGIKRFRRQRIYTS